MKRLKKLRFGKTTSYDIDKLYQQYTKSQLADKAFYYIGAGSFSHPCWTNVDFALKPGGCIRLTMPDAELEYQAGVAKIYRSGYWQNLLLPLRDTRYFDSTRPRISLYVEAFK